MFKIYQNEHLKNTTISQNFSNTTNTWKKQNQSSFFQNDISLKRKATHFNLSQRGFKNKFISLFNQAQFSYKSLKKNNSKRKQQVFSLDSKNQTNSSFFKMRKDHQKPFNSQNQQNNQEKIKNNHSTLTKTLSPSRANSLNQQQNVTKIDLSQSSLMKQMLANSLQKCKQKKTQKKQILDKIKDRDVSIQVGSRSKFIQKNQRFSSQIFHQSFITLIPQNKNYQNTDLITSKAESHQKGSNKKIIKTEASSHSSLKSEFNHFKHEDGHKGEKNREQIKSVCKNTLRQKENLNSYPADESIEEINLFNNQIESMTRNNKQSQQNSKINEIEQKKVSLKNFIEQLPLEKNIDESETQRIQYSKCSKKNITIDSQQQNNELSLYEAEIKQLDQNFQEIIKQKVQIDYIGIAVVQTVEHLRNYESVFWQLPMFFLYKKFYEKRLKLYQKIHQFVTKISFDKTKVSNFQEIQSKSAKYQFQLKSQNSNIEQSLKKLLKTVKKKMSKEYPNKEEKQCIEKHLHLDYTIKYDQIIDEFLYVYLKSLLQARNEFPELVIHIVQILDAFLVAKGKKIEKKDKQDTEKSKNKLQKTQNYFKNLLKNKQIMFLLRLEDGNKCKKLPK